jgi:ABC-type methionine transport system permease subunit
MIINTDSWHYKLYRFSYIVWNNEQDVPRYNTNLCQYVRHTVISLFFATLFWGFVGTMVGIMLFLIGRGIWFNPMLALKVFGWIVLGIAALVGVFWYMLSDTSEIVGEYIHAKTQGICPLIEFKRRDNNENQ